MEKSYVTAILELLNSGSDIESVLSNLRPVLTARGHIKLLPIVLRDLMRVLEQETVSEVAEITVARAGDTDALASEIKTALAALGADASSFTTNVDDSIIGGLIATYNSRQVDQSYRTSLSNLYQSITK